MSTSARASATMSPGNVLASCRPSWPEAPRMTIFISSMLPEVAKKRKPTVWRRGLVVRKMEARQRRTLLADRYFFERVGALFEGLRSDDFPLRVLLVPRLYDDFLTHGHALDRE